jgi:DNA replication protein DnaC
MNNDQTSTGTIRTLSVEFDPEWRDRIFHLDQHHPDVDELAGWGEWFIRRAFNDDRSEGTWLVLSGPPGCGKTHVARKVKRYLKDYAFDRYIQKGGPRLPNIEFCDWPRLAEMADDDDFQNASSDLLEADIAVLDDIGSETDRFRSAASNSRLRSILNVLEKRWLLVTTNIPKKRWNEVFGNRVGDRLNEAKYFNGENIPSYRGNSQRHAPAQQPTGPHSFASIATAV